MRILVTGSRFWSDYQTIEDAVFNAIAAFFPDGHGVDYDDIVIIHGCAGGADTLAQAVADDLGIKTERYPADWNKHGKAAGPLRNQQMVDTGADICLAFLYPDSRGTVDCMKRASDANIPVVKYYGGLT